MTFDRALVQIALRERNLDFGIDQRSIDRDGEIASHPTPIVEIRGPNLQLKVRLDAMVAREGRRQ